MRRVLKRPSFYLLLGLVLAVGACLAALFAEPDFSSRAIGIAILHGQDPGARTRVYVLVVLSAVCFFTGWFLRVDGARAAVRGAAGIHSLWLLLVLLAIANLALFWLDGDETFLRSVYALAYLAIFAAAVQRLFKDDISRAFCWIIAALAYQALLTAYGLWGSQPAFDLTFFIAFTALVLLAIGLLAYTPSCRNRDVILALGTALWPLALLPLTIIVAQELRYTLQVRGLLSVSVLTVWVFALGLQVMAAGLVHWYSWRRVQRPTGDREACLRLCRLLFRLYMPCILLTTVALNEYESAFAFQHFHDLFHGGEAVVPVQQLFDFGIVPYIDYYPTHGLFDMFPQAFYQLLNATPYEESLVWGMGYIRGWMPRMLAVLLLYWLLAKYVGYRVAFFSLLFLPTYQLFHPYYTPVLLPLLFVFMRAGTLIKWLLAGACIFLLLLWRVDFGVVSMCALTFVLLARWWLGMEREELSAILVAFFSVACVALALFVFLSLLKDRSPLHLLGQLMSYIGVQNYAAAKEGIIRGVDSMAVLQYLALPLVGVIYLAYFSAGTLSGRTLGRRHEILAYIAVVSLILSTRAINRHSHFLGGFNPFLFVFVAAALPLLVARLPAMARLAGFVGIVTASAALLPVSKNPADWFFYLTRPADQYATPSGKHKQFPILAETAMPDGRVRMADLGIDNVLDVIDDFLAEDETFFDFSNSPLLYGLSGRELPVYLMENFYHTSKSIQADTIARLDGYYQQGRLPLVIFSSREGIDGVDNEVRSYEIAEYVYRNFMPCAAVDEYELWVDRRRPGGRECFDYLLGELGADGASQNSPAWLRPYGGAPQTFDLKWLPYVQANYDPANVLSRADSASYRQILRASGQGPATSIWLDIPAAIDRRHGNYLHLSMQATAETEVTIEYAQGNALTFELQREQMPVSYLVRISSQYAWHAQEVSRVHLTSSAPVELRLAELYPGD